MVAVIVLRRVTLSVGTHIRRHITFRFSMLRRITGVLTSYGISPPTSSHTSSHFFGSTDGEKLCHHHARSSVIRNYEKPTTHHLSAPTLKSQTYTTPPPTTLTSPVTRVVNINGLWSSRRCRDKGNRATGVHLVRWRGRKYYTSHTPAL